MTTLDLARLVTELRGKQREYYHLRNRFPVAAAKLLPECKRLETNLDRTVAGILDAEAAPAASSECRPTVDPPVWFTDHPEPQKVVVPK